MVTDHSDVNKQATDLVAKFNITPQDNAISRSLKAEGKQNLEKLNGLSGDEFDRAYIDGEIKLHKELIGVGDSKLVSSVKNDELRVLLVEVRPSLASHLEHAKQIQASGESKRE